MLTSLYLGTLETQEQRTPVDAIGSHSKPITVQCYLYLSIGSKHFHGTLPLGRGTEALYPDNCLSDAALYLHTSGTYAYSL
jgi:hypothetical protein